MSQSAVVLVFLAEMEVVVEARVEVVAVMVVNTSVTLMTFDQEVVQK